MSFKITAQEETLSANGQTSEVKTVGQVRLTIVGTWGGGTAVLQHKKLDDTTWEDIPGASFTDDTAKAILYPPDAMNKLRVSLTGATSPSLKVTIQGSSRIWRAN